MAVLSSPHASGRIDWKDIRDRVDLAPVAIALLGPAPGRRGEHGRRLWWRCPFHEDGNPSFCVEPGKPWWRCYGCGERGDAPKLVMKLNGVGFPEAIRWITELAGIAAPAEVGGLKPPLPGGSEDSEPAARKPGKAAQTVLERSSSLPPHPDALALVAEAADRLWKPEGRQALAYLHSRGLTEETIRAARLGWTLRAEGVSWKPPGVIIPWLDGDRLALVKVRSSEEWRMRFPKEGRPPKYIEAYRDRPRIFPSLAAVRPGRPLIVTEGEFDCLLLAQELGELAAVVTLGSASNRPDPAILGVMLAAPVWFIATDADDAGDRSASGWPARARRVKPPGPNKDWTEAAQAGVGLRRWWSDRLAGTEAPPLFSWEELAGWRWGPALNDPTPENVPDLYTIAEREAIQTETLIDPTSD